ncbi:MAG TPA: hypothetical protein PLD57_18285 [Aggregatilineales bacterium]|nr:hypothetical protein [Aggregatilineales bacterium]
MPSSQITLWGERGLVASMLIDLAQLRGISHWESLFRECVEGARPLEAPIRSVMVVVEPDFSNTGFGHPDAMLRLDLDNGSARAVILEAKRRPYINSCKPPGARGTPGFNSSLNGQLELNHCLAIALAAHRPDSEELYEPAWVLETPYAADRRGHTRGVRSSVVMEEIVRPFSGIPLSGFMHVVITTDSSNPFADATSRKLLPELFMPNSLTDSRWDCLHDQYGWTSWWRIARFFAGLESAGTLIDSLFLPTFAKNRRNLSGRERGGAIPQAAVNPAPAEGAASGTDVRRLCRDFIAKMSANRPNCNDAGVAEDILRELDNRGQLTARTRHRLTHWCHTDGSVYQAGVPLARVICEAIYGCVLPRED